VPYLIDGYNLLRAVQSIHEGYAEINEDGLCRILSEYIKIKRSRGQIIFDGIGPPDRSILCGYGNLEVYFSGQRLEADDVIEDKIESNTAPKRLIVVSTDRRVRSAANSRRAVAVRSNLFFDDVIKVLDKSKITPEPKQKRHGLTEAETEAWLDIFDLD
jgi:predicted RNA-binding protein with PIN domain